MTYRRVVSCGLIAGLQKREIDRMPPCEVMDMYAYRMKYDSNLRGLI